jgi:membrane-bound ClpP family serine protease
MQKLYELLKSSVLVQGLIALGTLAVILYLYSTGQEPPQTLVNIFLIILGFYFGSKTQQTIDRRM